MASNFLLRSSIRLRPSSFLPRMWPGQPPVSLYEREVGHLYGLLSSTRSVSVLSNRVDALLYASHRHRRNHFDGSGFPSFRQLSTHFGDDDDGSKGKPSDDSSASNGENNDAGEPKPDSGKKKGRPKRAAPESSSGSEDANNNSNNNNNNNNNNAKSKKTTPKNASQSSVTAAASNEEEEKPLENVEGDEVMMERGPSLLNSLTTQQPIPEHVPQVLVIPIAKQPLFPRFYRMVEIKDKVLMKQIKMNMKLGKPLAGVFLRSNDDETADLVSDTSKLHPVGTLVQIQEAVQEEGKMRLILLGHRRIHITGTVVPEDPKDSLLRVNVENTVHDQYNLQDPEISALRNEVIKTIRDIAKMNPLYREAITQIIQQGLGNFEDAGNLADFGAALTTSASPEELQRVLSETSIASRLNVTLELLKKEYLQSKLQKDISREVEEKIQKTNREYMLKEQLKVINKELGITKDEKAAIIEKFTTRLATLVVPEDVKKVIDEEIARLSSLEVHSSEFGVTRNYIDWLTVLPWGQFSTDIYDLPRVATILDEDHYGMKDVKERIIEYVAVSSLRGSPTGKIICLVGPPGVGKTSIARSIARSLGRKYDRFSVGGLHDVAEIKGHRRTYVGAMPGKPIQCLKRTQSQNPLFLIDEIDKIGGKGYNGGDPTSALLELLDPEQNISFLDHYLDVPVDMSKVLFLCTANTLDTIPAPLLDRMEVIELSGYLASEKLQIAKRHVIPHALQQAGLKDKAVSIDDEALSYVISAYSRESGLRGLQKHIEKIVRKAAHQIVLGKEEVKVTKETVETYLGPPIFSKDEMYTTLPAGVSLGLGWTPVGGSTLYFETVAQPKEHGSFHCTGQLGDVMRESSTISYTFAKSFFASMYPSNNFFQKSDISLHVPEGAVKKDGPSAGCTMVTALLSLALGRAIPPQLAMTGELSLTGKILRVGGIKEKILAAKRALVTTVILPASCRRDFEELPADVREDIQVHFVTEYKEIFELVFPGQEPEKKV